MGIVERKEREKQELRERILDAAVQVFAEEGYENTSIRSIAKRIEYSPATIYLYFKDKNELLFAIHEVGFELLLKEMQKVATIENPLERLREIARTYIQFSIDHPEHYNLMFILMAPMEVIEKKEPWNEGQNAFGFLQMVIQECQDKGLIKKGESKEWAFFNWAFVHGLVSLHLRCRMMVMQQTEEEDRALIYKAVDEWIELIKV